MLGFKPSFARRTRLCDLPTGRSLGLQIFLLRLGRRATGYETKILRLEAKMPVALALVDRLGNSTNASDPINLLHSHVEGVSFGRRGASS